MSDSSDEDDLEALRLEALKSLKPKNQVNSALPASSSIDESAGRNLHHGYQVQSSQTSDPAASKSFHEHSSPSRNQSFEHEESERSLQNRSYYRHEAGNESNYRVDSHSNSRINYNSSRSLRRSRSRREHSFAKQTADLNFNSSQRNIRDFKNIYSRSRRQTNSADRKSARYRQSLSPKPNRSKANTSPQKYSGIRRNQKPYEGRKLPFQSNRGSGQSESSKKSCDEKSTNALASLPLCAPKHYVELFYGKKFSASSLNNLGVSNLVINDEDRALLSEKSISEEQAVQSALRTVSGSSKKLNESNQETDSSVEPASYRKDILSHQVKRIKETLQRRSLPLRLPRSRDRSRNERLIASHSRVSIRSKNSNKKPNEKSPSRRVLSGTLISEQDVDEPEEKSNHTSSEVDKPLDPVLEARRKKFESNDVVKVIPKRIKLTNQPAITDIIQTDESDLRNLLIAKHREKSISAFLYSRDQIDETEEYNSLNTFNSSELQSGHFEEIPAQTEDKVLNSNERIDPVSFMTSDFVSANHSENNQVRVKVEVETDLNENRDLEPPETSSLILNLEPPSVNLNSEDSIKAPTYSVSKTASEMENTPVFESADFACSISIKKEPEFNEPEGSFKIMEEQPLIDEPDLIPQQPDKPKDSATAAPFIKIKPLTELLDKKVLKKVKKSKKEEKKNKKRKKKSKSKDKDRENLTLKVSKRTAKIFSQNVSRKESYPARIVKSALEEALGKKKRKVFENDAETVIRKTNFDHHTSKDHRKVLILDEPHLEECLEESSSPSIAPAEPELDDSFKEDSERDEIPLRLSSKAPLYSSNKAKKRPDIYKMIQLNQIFLKKSVPLVIKLLIDEGDKVLQWKRMEQNSARTKQLCLFSKECGDGLLTGALLPGLMHDMMKPLFFVSVKK